MAKTFISFAIVITALLAVFAISGSNAECCNSTPVVKKCTGAPYEKFSWFLNIFHDEKMCIMDLCKDSKPPRDDHCGVGACNMFNCECVGGCRKAKQD